MRRARWRRGRARAEPAHGPHRRHRHGDRGAALAQRRVRSGDRRGRPAGKGVEAGVRQGRPEGVRRHRGRRLRRQVREGLGRRVPRRRGREGCLRPGHAPGLRGYPVGKCGVDRSFGADTEAAWRAFQRDHCGRWTASAASTTARSFSPGDRPPSGWSCPCSGGSTPGLSPKGKAHPRGCAFGVQGRCFRDVPKSRPIRSLPRSLAPRPRPRSSPSTCRKPCRPRARCRAYGWLRVAGRLALAAPVAVDRHHHVAASSAASWHTRTWSSMDSSRWVCDE